MDDSDRKIKCERGKTSAHLKFPLSGGVSAVAFRLFLLRLKAAFDIETIEQLDA